MSHEIRWTPKAITQVKGIVDYLEANWGQKTADKFVLKVNKIVLSTTQLPEIHPTSDKRKGARKIIISGKSILYYGIIKNQIRIISVFDHRQVK